MVDSSAQADAMSPGLPPIGVWLYPVAPVVELVGAIVLAEHFGFDEVWVADEGVARDPFVLLAAAATATTRIRLGIGITSPALRHPGHAAAAAATLDELSDGRMVLGFGVGGHESLGPFGIEVRNPVDHMRSALSAARAVLARVDGAGFTVPPHASPSRRVPIYVGARGPRLNQLASEVADGAFLSGFTDDGLATAVQHVRTHRPVDIAIYQSVRFRTRVDDDATSIRGTPSAIAHALMSVVERHRPTSIGMALVDGAPPMTMMEDAGEVLRALLATNPRR
jgi:alkanesulfonate monooxygenase SsuD/methylene tetrahydromethanopterin reductase-like flavin-dependent oxidoreductase (luciferase family)